MRSKVTLLNMLSSLLFRVCLVISGFIIPRIVLHYFGSTMNGLVASISQFLKYIALIEGGVTAVVSANLYKPLVDADHDRLSSVISAAKRFYRGIGTIFIVYSLCLAVIYPLASGLDFLFAGSLTVILSIALLMQYMFSITYQTLFKADKKGYIVFLLQSAITLLNVALVYVSIKIYPSIHLIYLINGLLYTIQPLIFDYYAKKYYAIDWKAKPDRNLLKDRWNGFAINLAAFIHNGTDVAVLTVFTGLPTVSVYSVYALVASNGLKTLIQSLVSGIDPAIGQIYARGDMKALHQKMDLYEYIVFFLVFFLFTMGGLLITPFVMLYTKGVTDADYYQPLFGFLLVLAEAIYLLKSPHCTLAYSANQFKKLTVPAFMEAFLNIAVSIALIKHLGLIGVAIGTCVAMSYRMVFHIYFTTKIIPGRKQWFFYRKLLLFLAATGIGVSVCYFGLPLNEYSLLPWLLHAAAYAGILGVLYLVLSVLFFRKELQFIFQYLIKRKQKHEGSAPIRCV
ncbi:polysaccharide biosynthesis C-terminal domain-containing protein [Aristaeella hokkaidonensis]|uniref:Polysaccharide biosynthesis protein n=1 Tax=Aristaeella hokkaidonensis TaxID=3046382 RepID=A0AC61N3H0_9FIRM|nr:polysaccharide biosynthesis C-terminal domain-containing protein [Aristaeella hokkaidonensis]QUC68519.1 polysaccharide biosynthesis protein [Aristaeella hokkaidonensis]SNT94996.1 Membrane protein involved in the export of O-antigen and teichoic acid [Aristaeella hokkaidonensis]